MEAMNARDVQRASKWNNTNESKKLNWYMPNLNDYQKYFVKEGGPDDDSAFPPPNRTERMIRRAPPRCPTG